MRWILSVSLLFLLMACEGQSSPGSSQTTNSAETSLEDNSPKNTANCVDPARIDAERVCTMEYLPVCACNGQTYSNACVAAASGLLAWEPGACPEHE